MVVPLPTTVTVPSLAIVATAGLRFVIGTATDTKTASVYVKNDGTAKTTNLAALIPAGEPGTAAYAVTSVAVNLDFGAMVKEALPVPIAVSLVNATFTV